MKKNYLLIAFAAVFFIMLLKSSCSCGGEGRYTEEGLDTVIKEYSETPTYTILLHDQSYENNKYKHEYQILIPKADSTLESVLSAPYVVSDRFFNAHVNDMGMELANKKDGKLTKAVSPAGYSQYVGNKKYGQWRERSGGSFWEFYGKYAFMSSMFHMGASPARYGYYNDYRNNYYSSGRTYRGPNNYYGTQSYMKSNTGRTSSWSQKPSSFRSDVRSRVKQSSTSSSSSSRTSRSSNRSSSSSSSRSRSGGGGK